MVNSTLPRERNFDRLLALLLVADIVAMFAGFTVLADAFHFPQILRASADERLALFRAHRASIVPTYWMLAMTGIALVFISVLLARSLGPKAGSASRLVLAFGVVAGFAQATGFGRWAILVPWLADRMADPSLSDTGRETIALIEGAFNRYAGMLIGEHLGNICWGFWLFFTGMAIRRSGAVDRRIGSAAMLLSPLFGLLAAEQLGFDGAILGLLTDFGFPLLALIHFALAWQLVRRHDDAPAPPLGLPSALTGTVLYAAMIWPALGL